MSVSVLTWHGRGCAGCHDGDTGPTASIFDQLRRQCGRTAAVVGPAATCRRFAAASSADIYPAADTAAAAARAVALVRKGAAAKPPPSQKRSGGGGGGGRAAPNLLVVFLDPDHRPESAAPATTADGADAGPSAGDDAASWAGVDGAVATVWSACPPSTLVVGLALHGKPASNSVVEHGYVFAAMA